MLRSSRNHQGGNIELGAQAADPSGTLPPSSACLNERHYAMTQALNFGYRWVSARVAKRAIIGVPES